MQNLDVIWSMLAHVPLAIGTQLPCWAIGRALGAPTKASIWMGCFAGSAVCIVREVTQREYQWIEAFGHGLRKNMPTFAGAKFWEWNSHSIVETLVAIAAAGAVAGVVSSRVGKS